MSCDELNNDQVLELKRMVDKGMPKKDVAEHFGISRQTLYRVLAKLRKS